MTHSASLMVRLRKTVKQALKSRLRNKRLRRLRLEGLEERRYLAGDLWTQRGGDAGHDYYVDTTIDFSQLNHAWTARPANPQSTMGLDLAIDTSRVYRTEYVGYSNGFVNYLVVARDINTGAAIWSTPLSSYSGEVSEPTIANGIVYVDSAGHSGISGGTDAMVPKLYGLDAATGAIVLTQRYQAQWGSGDRPVVSNNRLIVEDGYYGGISSYQASTLTRQWFVGRSAAYDPPRAAVDDSYAYAFNNEVYNLATGARTFITHPTPGTSLYTPTVSSSGKIIFGSSTGISAFDGDTHQHLWTSNLAAANKFAVGNGLIAVSGGSGLKLLRESDGALVGSWNAPEGLPTNEVILTNSHVLVQSSYFGLARIHALSLNDLTETWRYENRLTSGYARMGMSLVDGRLALTHESFTRVFAVGAPNNAPTALNDGMFTSEDEPVTVDVVANDSDLDGHSLTVISTSVPANGTVTINDGKTVTYRPATNYFGTDQFTYVVSDGRGGTTTATVNVSVSAVNDPPVAFGNRLVLNEDSTLSNRAAGVDPDGTSIIFQIQTPPANGTLQFNGTNGDFTYTPNANFFGTDAFVFVVNDGTLSSQPARIDLVVNAVNDAPVAIPMTIQMNEDGLAEGQLSASDVDSALLSFLAGTASGGALTVAPDGRFSYRPPLNFNGSASFTFQVSDGELTSAPAVVNVNVVPVNDAPVVTPATFTVPENLPNGSVVGTVAASDVDSTALTYAISGVDAAPFAINPQTGTLTVVNSLLLDYERQTDFVFTATVTDSQGASGSALIRVRLGNVLDINMDVIPGDPTNTINLTSKEVQVALLGSSEFNPATVDLASVRLRGPSSASGAPILKSGRNYKISFIDVNGDGILDLVMSFSTSSTGLKVGDTSVQLSGVRSTPTGPVGFNLAQAVRVVGKR